MNKYNNTFNLTSLFKAPVFLSQKFFVGQNKDNYNLFDQIDILDEDGKKVVQNPADILSLTVQPKTGVPVYADITVQMNIDGSKNS